MSKKNNLKISDIEIEVTLGDIANQPDVEAVVNAANAELRTGGGVAGALHRAAGPELAEEGRKYAPIRPGEAVITKGYNLPTPYVIHCLGPIYGVNNPADKLLANCYSNALRIAEENELSSIAFPAISTGAFRYPFDEASDVAIATTTEICGDLKHVKKIRFVLFDAGEKEFFKSKLAQVESTL
ncbi:MAG: macro domain-containing protein [Flavobacteriales bacterium]|nr:macro domain-containing protein [Flavobacteriales bacterium]